MPDAFSPARRRFLALTGTAAIGSVLPELTRAAPAVATLTGEAFATSWHIALPAGTDPERHRAPIDALLAEIDAQMSPWRADSLITRFNQAGAGSIDVPAETARVTAAALDLAQTTQGAFDPAIGPAVARWGFGPIEGAASSADGLAIEGETLSKAHPGLTLDLCGIAKGRALDLMVTHLLDAGHENFLIDLGGELAARGTHPEGRPWHVGVEDPRPDSAGMAEVLALNGMAVATSGNRANGYTLGTRRYSHIIDPATMEPVKGNLASVSVIAPDAMTADAWATALFAAGDTHGPALARKHGIAALFLTASASGLTRLATGGFDTHLA
ncbi:FAD:protein FMN transferase [Pseudoruegeria sp. HB172150]|uniref:FAD:protein FMN transferase n=1 Tax=Pseudoruegeria sp. HB172150 TaxID=2721164 RepID=UPI001552C6C1|nr:FAD:protein FMN transferase [Pseudoruegeria sp. HB172150]